MVQLGTLILLVVVSNLGGTLVRAARLPRVLGVMCVGVALGVLLADVGPGLGVGALLEKGSFLDGAATLGIALFMVEVGHHLRVPVSREAARGGGRALACVLLVTGVPFVAGWATAFVTYDAWAGDGVGFAEFAAMQGCLLTLTAVPVLQRILVEYGLTSTPVGRFTLTQSLVTDVLVWGLVTVVVGVRGRGDPVMAIGVLLGSFVVVLLACRAWEWCCARAGAGLRARAIALVVLVVVLAHAGEALGQSALIVGLAVGVCLRRNRAVDTTASAIGRVNVRSLFPLFFVQIGLTLDAWSGAGLDLPVAVVGGVMAVAYGVKWLASWAGARVHGLGAASGGVATLLSLRGATELALAVTLYESGLVDGAGLTAFIVFAVVSTLVAALCSLPLRVRAEPGRAGPALTEPAAEPARTAVVQAGP